MARLIRLHLYVRMVSGDVVEALLDQHLEVDRRDTGHEPEVAGVQVLTGVDDRLDHVLGAICRWVYH